MFVLLCVNAAGYCKHPKLQLEKTGQPCRGIRVKRLAMAEWRVDQVYGSRFKVCVASEQPLHDARDKYPDPRSSLDAP